MLGPAHGVRGIRVTRINTMDEGVAAGVTIQEAGYAGATMEEGVA